MKKSKKKEDTFGMNDEDWNVYRKIVSLCCTGLDSVTGYSFSAVGHILADCSSELHIEHP